MRYRYGTANGNLPSEKWNHASVATKNIAESNRHIFCIFTGLVHVLHNQFAQIFGCPHNISRVDGLIRGDQHKTLYVSHIRRFCRIESTAYIVLDCLNGANLHQRYMLVCRRMKYHIRPILCKNLVQAWNIPHRTNDNLQIKPVPIDALKIYIKFIGIVFVDIKNYQFFWIKFCDLPTKLGTNRTAATCD
ncbi:hypothetical protein SDC9_138419 [bioreactor metagenome]|uniref:Uncharacterized protein n=1 Tax=bioreactor metagenome TaxID=1076179 RepID=A0A645DPS2_9ZZZZ